MDVRARQAEVIRRVLEADRVDLHTALPGVVRSYDAAAQVADIALGVKRVLPAQDDDDPDAVEAYPILPSVPVLFPRSTGGGYYLHIPLQEGDGVLVIFAESDISRWRETGQPHEDPGIGLRHGLSGAVAIPGLHWRGNPNGDAGSAYRAHLDRIADANAEDVGAGMRLGVEGGTRIEIVSNQIRAGGNAQIAMASQTDAQLSAIAADLATLQTAINAIASGSVPSLTITTARPANPIGSNTLRGA